ncbi:MAG: hypothetical protein Q4C70_14365 [Planctomycetia bacterium]|nr:hypothetical protein [Planctomycetia bacterium]
MDTTLRKNIYALMIFLSLGLILGRIFAVDTVNKQDLQKYRLNQIPKQMAEKEERLKNLGESPEAIATEMAKTEVKLLESAQLCVPFFSANDRSRWCTIRALVEPEMRVEGAPYAIDKVRLLRGWDTIDMVKHDDHYYSSKPPLFPTLMAGVYWVLLNVFGISFTSHLYLTCIVILACVNLPFMALFLWATTQLAELFGKTDRARIFMVAAACFATFLSTFCVTLNNHLPAVACTATVLYFAMEMILSGKFKPENFFLIGVLSMFMVINELPSLSFFVAILIALVLYLPWKTEFRRSVMQIVLWALGVVSVLTPILGTNYIAHQSFRPPYMHRQEGDNWYEYTYQTANGREVKSYWQEPKGLDVGEPSRAKYAFHLTMGHHGVFSLTPIWILSMVGACMLLRSPDRRLQLFGLMVIGLTALILAFYIMRPLGDRNYGGNTCGLRWTFWLIPLWLCTLIPAVEKLENRPILWRLALLLLLFSAISVSYPTWNPWTHPWLYNL